LLSAFSDVPLPNKVWFKNNIIKSTFRIPTTINYPFAYYYSTNLKSWEETTPLMNRNLCYAALSAAPTLAPTPPLIAWDAAEKLGCAA
jgi:hypothetical protein